MRCRRQSARCRAPVAPNRSPPALLTVGAKTPSSIESDEIERYYQQSTRLAAWEIADYSEPSRFALDRGMVMARRGQCRCGLVLTFHRTAHGYKMRCPSCVA